MEKIKLLTRREFLQASAATGAALAAGGLLAACTSGDDAQGGDGTVPGGAEIVAVAIHPAIGIARVGNSADSFYFGPEVPGALPRAPEGFKDATGAIARQAARFRLYGLDAQGDVVRELSDADGPISWTVSVANKKAAWYDFNTALDIPVAEPVGRRNASVTGADRAALVVSSGPRTISAVGGARPAPVALGGAFQGVDVPLGELMVDGQGRLVLLPAEGKGYSPSSAPLTTFSDNDGWADDTCDGPVGATIEIGGRTLSAEPAWVVVTPPNYGPALATGMVTAEDSARLGWGSLAPELAGEAVSFERDVLPVFARLVDMQWVNAGFLELNGWGSPADYLSPPLLDRLADPSAANADFRRQLLAQFRDPSYGAEQPTQIPQVYGDGVAIPAESAYQWLTVTPVQYEALRRWADGDFTDDRRAGPPPTTLEELPVADQPAALDRAGLESCLGGAYHPGIELPWSLRVPSMWAAPRRLAVRGFEVEDGDYGDELTPEVCLSPTGPLAGSGPGDLTRWQGVPWQSDAASCRSGYQPEVSPVLPTFWPARIPNHVLRESDYRVVVDTTRPMAERQAAFDRRFDWERFVAGPTREETLQNMMAGWWSLGLVTDQPGPDDGAFPAVMKVETMVGFPVEPEVSYGPRYQAQSPEVGRGAPVPS